MQLDIKNLLTFIKNGIYYIDFKNKYSKLYVSMLSTGKIIFNNKKSKITCSTVRLL